MAGLGRGLDALLSASRAKQLRDADLQPDEQQPVSAELTGITDYSGQTSPEHMAPTSAGLTMEIDVAHLITSRYQPRRMFDDDSLDELAASIRTHGLLEPLLVMRSGDKYEIVCGERRFRASKLAGLQRVPCLIRDALAEEAYAIALIENIQREDLNPLELAGALQQMQQECGMTQEDLAHTLGMSRSTITNYLRLNHLDEQVREALAERLIDMGHAKVILGLNPEQQSLACKEIIRKDLSVRQTEMYVRSLKSKTTGEDEAQTDNTAGQFQEYEKTLSSLLHGARVRFAATREDHGRITLSYTTREQFDRIMEILGLHGASHP